MLPTSYNQKGQGVVEYLLIMVLVAFVVIGIYYILIKPPIESVAPNVCRNLKMDPGECQNIVSELLLNARVVLMAFTGVVFLALIGLCIVTRFQTNAAINGQGLVEYAMLLVVVAIVVIVILAVWGEEIGDLLMRFICSNSQCKIPGCENYLDFCQ